MDRNPAVADPEPSAPSGDPSGDPSPVPSQPDTSNIFLGAIGEPDASEPSGDASSARTELDAARAELARMLAEVAKLEADTPKAPTIGQPAPYRRRGAASATRRSNRKAKADARAARPSCASTSSPVATR